MDTNASLHFLSVIRVYSCAFAVGLLAGCAQPKPVLLNSDVLQNAPLPPALIRTALGADTVGRTFDHAAWGTLLKIGIKEDGSVDYAALKAREYDLNNYLVEVGNVPLVELSRYEQLALLLNAYNACTVKMILENPGCKSVSDIPASRGWRQQGWVIDRTGVSIEQLEQDYLRKRFPDPRLHFALGRGARGCPPLGREPYTGAQLIRQLDEQARRTMADERFCVWDAATDTLRLGGIFERYRKDFADNDAGLIHELLPWLPSSTREALRGETTIQLEFTPFDWRLNGTW